LNANIEIKARVLNSDRFAETASEITGSQPEEIVQHDVFFHATRGRLKLRMFPDGTGELIQYSRPDQDGPKTSHYVLAPTDQPAKLREALSTALGEIGEVKKRRQLWLSGRTRIHLDEVSELGWFMELEVVMGDGDCSAEATAEAEELKDRLGVVAADLVDRAYIDLLMETDA
jgi:predicted adenylyl cyclase CyaB